MTGKTLSDFGHFYATDLVKELKQLEAMRRAVLGKVMILLAVVGGLGVLAVGLDLGYRLSGWLALLGVAVCAGAGRFLYGLLISEYVHCFKTRVITRIVAFIDPGLEYWARGHIEPWQFTSSRIFQRAPDRFRGDDHVKGRLGDTRIEFSEIHAEYKTETHGRSGRRRNWHTIFKGLFFVADFNKQFYGRTVVLPDTAEKVFGGAGSFLQSLNRGRGELVKLEDPEFEKYFVVYGDDQIESRYILSTSLMERIVNFRKKTGRPVHLSFVGSQVFVAVPYTKALFEPKVFTSIVGFSSAEGYFDDLHLAVGIVDDLNLNTRIWTKQPA
ncbi:MAG: DUF3137 domain-containing protein [bacterium]